jgi:hypothetical protein
MKIRNGYVSNSSSSSFIIFNSKELIPDGVEYVELDEEQKIRLWKETKRSFGLRDHVYLTEFVSDGRDEYSDLYDLSEKYVYVYTYHEGGHGYPYDEEQYDKLGNNVWLQKEWL